MGSYSVWFSPCMDEQHLIFSAGNLVHVRPRQGGTTQQYRREVLFILHFIFYFRTVAQMLFVLKWGKGPAFQFRQR